MYHQCVPNPVKHGELITVQLFTPKLDHANPDHSLDEMVKQGIDPNTLYAHYNTSDFIKLKRKVTKMFKSMLTG